MKLLKILWVINIMYISSLAANKMANGFFEIGNAYIIPKAMNINITKNMTSLNIVSCNISQQLP